VNRRNVMADPASIEDGAAALRPRAGLCRYLRSNGMYIFDAQPGGSDDPDYEPSGCWCLQTMKLFGPDDDLVGPQECRDSDRACYEPV
jgi:hypothetical protein